MRNVIPAWGTKMAYEAGVEARDLGKDKTPPGGLGAQRRSFWLAGYNDRDIELQVERQKKIRGYGQTLREHAVIATSLDVLDGPTSCRSEP